MTQLTVGHKLLAASGSWTPLGGTNRQGAAKAPAYVSPQSLLVTHLGGWLRKDSLSPKAQFAVWAKTEAGLPGELLAYTNPLSVGATGNGANFEAAIAWSRDGVALGQTNAALRLMANQEVFLGVQEDGGALDVALMTVGPTTAWHRRNTGDPANPTDPFTPANQLTINAPALYMTGIVDTAPVTTMTGPAASVSSATPTIIGTWADAESGSPTFDRIKTYQIEVRDPTTTAIYWSQTFTATPAERAAFAFSQVYAGTALGNGTFEVRARAQDDVLTLGEWSAWRSFTVANLGAVDIAASAPTGKDEDGVLGPFTARWTHPSATAMNAAWVRILSAGTVIRQTPALVSQSVADNAIISLSSAQAAVALAADPLPPGAYTWQMQGRDTTGAFSGWSADVAFSVNSPPNQPSALSPSGVTVVERPQLEAGLSDPDLDDVLGVGVEAQYEITRPDLSVVTRTSLLVEPSTGRSYYQVTATDAPVNGVYTWRVRGRDISANVFGPWSAPALFTLATAPLVTITTPAQNAIVVTGTPQIAWTVTDGPMVRYRVRLYRSGAALPFFSTEEVAVSPAATSGSFTVPAGWLANSTIYEADVTIWTAGELAGTSARRRFTVAYTAADALLAVDSSLVQYARDVEATSVRIAWARTTYPTAQFEGYEVWRRSADDDPSSAVRVALIAQPGQTSWVDHHAPPNDTHIYAVTQLRRAANGDVTTSIPVETSIDVTLTTPVLTSLINGAEVRATTKWLAGDLSGGLNRKDAMLETWGTGGKPTWVRPPANFGQEVMAIGWIIKGDDRGTLRQHYRDVQAMLRSGEPVSLRTERDRIFCRLVPSGRWWRRGAPGQIQINLTAEEISWQESTVIGG